MTLLFVKKIIIKENSMASMAHVALNSLNRKFNNRKSLASMALVTLTLCGIKTNNWSLVVPLVPSVPLYFFNFLKK
jgi:hypothetical protein